MSHPRLIVQCTGPQPFASRKRPTRHRLCDADRRQDGFTLVELMVIISIIVILIAIGAVAAFRAISIGARQQTRFTLIAASGIAEEYLAATGMTVSDTTPDPPDDPIERFVLAVSAVPSTSKMLPSLGKEQLGDFDGDSSDEVVDGWGRQLTYAFGGPQSAVPFFASSGRDGQWGTDDDLNSLDLE